MSEVKMGGSPVGTSAQGGKRLTKQTEGALLKVMNIDFTR